MKQLKLARLRVAVSAPGPVPWLAHLGASLKQLPSVDLVDPDDGALDVLIDMDAARRAPPSGAARVWTLVDGQHRALHGPAAWAHALARAQGARIALLGWTRTGWCMLRDSHAAGPTLPSDGPGRAYAGLAAMVAQALTDIRLGSVPTEVDLCPAPRPAVRHGEWLHRLQARWACGVRQQRARWLTEHWRVGVVEQPIHTLLAARRMPPVRWLTPLDRAGYWADPFGLPGSPDLLFCERYDERSAVGHLECLRLRGAGVEVVSRLPVGRGHASFPNVFESDGQVYGLAETSADRECVLHRVGSDGRWEPFTTLLRGVAAADPSIFRWEGRWWLAFTDVQQGALDNLCLYHADRLEGPWQPHENNPVKVDVAGARMAGRHFMHEGHLYRPSQDCREGYGHALALYRVDEVSPTRYRETLVQRLLPTAGSETPEGLHTLTPWGDRTLVDGKRLVFNPLVLRGKLARWWGLDKRTAPTVPKRS